MAAVLQNSSLWPLVMLMNIFKVAVPKINILLLFIQLLFIIFFILGYKPKSQEHIWRSPEQTEIACNGMVLYRWWSQSERNSFQLASNSRAFNCVGKFGCSGATSHQLAQNDDSPHIQWSRASGRKCSGSCGCSPRCPWCSLWRVRTSPAEPPESQRTSWSSAPRCWKHTMGKWH